MRVSARTLLNIGQATAKHEDGLTVVMSAIRRSAAASHYHSDTMGDRVQPQFVTVSGSKSNVNLYSALL